MQQIRQIRQVRQIRQIQHPVRFARIVRFVRFVGTGVLLQCVTGWLPHRNSGLRRRSAVAMRYWAAGADAKDSKRESDESAQSKIQKMVKVKVEVQRPTSLGGNWRFRSFGRSFVRPFG